MAVPNQMFEANVESIAFGFGTWLLIQRCIMNISYLGWISRRNAHLPHSDIVAVGGLCIGPVTTANHIRVSEVLDEFFGTGWGMRATH